MRTPITLTILALAAVLLLSPGCSTTGPDGSRVPDPVKTAKVKAALQPVLSSIVTRVLENNRAHAAEIGGYFRAVGSIFCRMEATGQFSPDVLLAQANALGAPAIAGMDPAITDVKNALLSLYQIQWADRLNVDVSPDRWGGFLAALFCESIDTGLRDAGQAGSR